MIASTTTSPITLATVIFASAQTGGNLRREESEMSSSSMSVPDDHLKLVPALRAYFHQIKGVVWAVSWGRNIRNGAFQDSSSRPSSSGS